MSLLRATDRARFHAAFGAALSAGLEVDRAAQLAAGPAEPLASLGRAVAENVAAGRTLAESLTATGLLPRAEVGVLASAERAGRLPEVSEALGRRLERTIALRRSLVNGLLYPAAVLVAALILPTLPILVTVGPGAWLRSVLPGLLVLVAVTFGVRRTGPDAAWRLGRRLPVLGPALLRIDVAELLASLRLGIGAGVPLAETFEGASETLRSPALLRATRRMAAGVRRGRGLAVVFAAESAVFTPEVVAGVDVGERAGRLEDGLLSLEDAARHDAETALRRLVVLAPVAALVVAGIVVGLLALGAWRDVVANLG